jgi:uncharacterized protein (DUF924 family)
MSDDILAFWFGATGLHHPTPPALRQRWFQGGPAFDDEVRARFADLFDHLDEVEAWPGPGGRLAAILVTDQFSRQLFRRTARAFATDALALRLAEDAIARGWDHAVGPVQRGFVYLPLMHAEDPGVAQRSVALYAALAADPEADDAVRAQLGYAAKHRDIVLRFGRYPGRNAALGREDTPEELAWLAAGGDTFGAR